MGDLHCAECGDPCSCDGIDLPDGTTVCVRDGPRCESCGEVNPSHYAASALHPEVWLCDACAEGR